MEGPPFVQLALSTLSCTQKELAAKIGVSATQITKWKQGEYMSFEMVQRFQALTGIGDHPPELVLWTGSLAQSKKWTALTHYLAELAQDNDESGYETYPLLDENGLLCYSTLHTLREMGLSIPQVFPKELDINYEKITELDDESAEAFDAAIDSNIYSDLIYQIYKSLTDVYGFYAAYIEEISDDDNLNLFGLIQDIESSLIDLAACKLEIAKEQAPKIQVFKRRVEKNYASWLTSLKAKALRNGIPLRAEILDLIYDSHDELRRTAEAESLGLNDRKLHPDIYMNELLVGMRAIHQVLPAIMKKLGIHEEFTLDTSEFRIGN